MISTHTLHILSSELPFRYLLFCNLKLIHLILSQSHLSFCQYFDKCSFSENILNKLELLDLNWSLLKCLLPLHWAPGRRGLNWFLHLFTLWLWTRFPFFSSWRSKSVITRLVIRNISSSQSHSPCCDAERSGVAKSLSSSTIWTLEVSREGKTLPWGVSSLQSHFQEFFSFLYY